MKNLFFLFLFASFIATAQIDSVTTKSGLKIVYLQKGEGETPKKKQRISVHYIGKFKDGKIFDSSLDKPPLKFRVGWGDVIPAWDEAFMMFNKGTRAILYVPAKIGYGAKGMEHPQDDYFIVPPNSDLIFEVELVELN
jgi:peptidyl-prolyl cis-trans isomerase A (cyclophilin A)